MNILVDILHPAHVHFFKHAIWQWQENGHRVCVTAREKEIATVLLDRYGIPYENLGPARSGLLGLAGELLRRDRRLLRIARRFRPDVMTGIAGVSIAHLGSLLRIPSVVFTDTENATLSNRLTFPFASAVCTPTCYEGSVPARKHVPYPGYHELAYLHPDIFTPDPELLTRLGLRENEDFIVLRLIAWGAAHDVHDRGFRDVEEVVRRLRRHARVLITSEAPVAPSLRPHLTTVEPEHIHHLLYYARLYIGESATMASESAVLGTPAVFVSTSTRGYTNEQERCYDLVHTFSNPETAESEALAKAEEILADPEAKARGRRKRDAMLADKTNVTRFILEVVERYAGGS